MAASGEAAIVLELARVLQGAEPRMFGRAGDAVQQTVQFVAPLTASSLELGRMYRELSSALTGEAAGGCLVRDAYLGAMRAEVEGYLRSLAGLDADMRAPAGGAAAISTVRALCVWSDERLPTLRALASLHDMCRGARGAALASAVHTCSLNGDPRVAAPLTRVLRATCRPIVAAAACWMLFGAEAEDGEVAGGKSAPFFWAAAGGHDPTFVPTFVPSSLAQRVAATGAATRFLRFDCSDGAWLRDFAAGKGKGVESEGGGDPTGLRALEELVHAVQPSVDTRLRHVLCTGFELPSHLRALRRYALLGQGDFASALMAGCDSAGLLDAPASTLALSPHDMAGALEGAIRASNAARDSRELTDRLGLALYGHGPGRTGWDTLHVTYALRPPLSAIVPTAAYTPLFAFLWRLKHAEYVLCRMWAGHMSAYHALSALGHASLAALLHTCHTVRGHMTHTVSSLTAFAQCDVLSPAFEALEGSVGCARDMHALTAAHAAFITTATAGCFLASAGGRVGAAISALVGEVLTFSRLQDELYQGAGELAPAPGEGRGRGTRRTPAPALTDGEVAALDAALAPYQAPLRAAAAGYQQGLASLLAELQAACEESQELHVVCASLGARLNVSL